MKNLINIVPIPGVSPITATSSVSGFKDQFLFYGFLPKTETELYKALELLSQIKYSLIFFTIKNKLLFKGFKKFFSGRKILIAKEITKIHETSD